MNEQVPYSVHAAAEERSERAYKRLLRTLVFVAALVFIDNVIWLLAWMIK